MPPDEASLNVVIQVKDNWQSYKFRETPLSAGCVCRQSFEPKFENDFSWCPWARPRQWLITKRTSTHSSKNRLQARALCGLLPLSWALSIGKIWTETEVHTWEFPSRKDVSASTKVWFQVEVHFIQTKHQWKSAQVWCEVTEASNCQLFWKLRQSDTDVYHRVFIR